MKRIFALGILAALMFSAGPGENESSGSGGGHEPEHDAQKGHQEVGTDNTGTPIPGQKEDHQDGDDGEELAGGGSPREAGEENGGE